MHNTYYNGDNVSNVDILYLGRQYSGEQRQQESEMENIRILLLMICRINIFNPNLPAVLDFG
jgi:hypothetical protein